MLGSRIVLDMQVALGQNPGTYDRRLAGRLRDHGLLSIDDEFLVFQLSV